MRHRKIKRLWQGLASLRDYEVEDAIKAGGVVLSCGGEKMTLTTDQLKKGLQTTQDKHKSKFNFNQTYKLIDFRWVPNKEKENEQMLF